MFFFLDLERNEEFIGFILCMFSVVLISIFNTILKKFEVNKLSKTNEVPLWYEIWSQ